MSSFTASGYNAAMPQLTVRAKNLTGFLVEHFPPEALAETRKKFADMHTIEAMLSGADNPVMRDLIPLVEAELESGCTLLWTISRHLAMLVPAIEDGNNFGVDVLQSSLKVVQDRESVMSQ